MKELLSWAASPFLMTLQPAYLLGMAIEFVVMIPHMSSLNRNWAEPISFLHKSKAASPLQLWSIQRESDKSITQISRFFLLWYWIWIFLPLLSQFSLLINLTCITHLDLRGSHLQGPIPNLPQLQELYVADNEDLTVNVSWLFALPWPHSHTLSNFNSIHEHCCSNSTLHLKWLFIGCSSCIKLFNLRTYPLFAYKPFYT